MEFRGQTAIGAAVLVLLSAAVARAQGDLSYEARHEHLRKSCSGELRITAQGVSFEETGGKKPEKQHRFRWQYGDIQQLEVTPDELRVVSYQDDPWKLGGDRAYTFRVAGPRDFRDAYAMLKDKLDQRFVAALADTVSKPLWQVPVKHLTRFGGAEGTLVVGPELIVFEAPRRGDSRTWRYEDIEGISSSGPYQLTVTTFERAPSHYGSLKGFNFQLKERLPEERYNALWRRLNQAKGLKLLTYD